MVLFQQLSCYKSAPQFWSGIQIVAVGVQVVQHQMKVEQLPDLEIISTLG
jgi:hypothetical protein